MDDVGLWQTLYSFTATSGGPTGPNDVILYSESLIVFPASKQNQKVQVEAIIFLASTSP